MVQVEFSIDTSKAQEAIDLTIGSMLKFSQKATAEVNRQIISTIKGKVATTYNLNNQDEYKEYKPDLINSYKTFSSKYNEFESFIYSRIYYSRFLEYGVKNAVPRKKKYLTFKYKGHFYNAKSISITARPIMTETVNAVYGSNIASTTIENSINSQLAKFWGDV